MGEKTRLVGRAPEVAVLEAEWQRAASGELRCVLLSGDAGLGKTSLAEDTVARHVDAATTLSARARPLGAVASFGLWAEALDTHLRDLPAEEIRELCGGPLDDLASLLHSVAAVRGSVPDREPHRSRLLQSLGTLIQNLARRQPVVLVLDDMHQADASSWDLLHFLAQHFSRIPALVLATARSGEMADQPLPVRVLLDLEQEGALRRIEVEPLGHEPLRELAEDVIGGAVGKDVVDWISERSQGNPLYAIGLLRSLREEGGVARPGLRRLPEELTARIRAHVGTLGPDDLALLELLAVAGGRVELGELARFSDHSLEDLSPVLQRLTRTRLVTEEERAHRVGYEVAHPVIRDTIYDGIGGARRVALHRQVGRALLIAGRLGEAALHFARSAVAGDDEAIEVLQEALRQAEERGAYREGMRVLAALVELLPSGDERWRAVADALFEGAEWVVDHRADADTRTAVAALREIDALLGESPDLSRRGAVKSRLASFLSWGTGDMAAAAEAAAAAVDLHREAREPTAAGLAALELAYARGLAGDVPALEDGAAAVLAEAEAAGDDHVALRAVGVRGTAAFYRGRFADGEEALRRSVALALRRGQDYRVTWALMSLGWCLGYEGRLEESLAAFAEAKAANTAWRDANVLELESNVRWLAGDYRGGRDCAREAFAINPGDQSLRRGHGLAVAVLSEVELEEVADARRDAEAASRVYGGRAWFFASDVFTHAQGVLAWRDGRLPQALATLRTAADGMVDKDVVVFAAPVLVDLAEVAAETGDVEAASGAVERLATIAGRTDRDLYRALADLGAAWAALTRGDRAAAAEPAAAALDRLRPLGYRGFVGRALVARGHALEARDETTALTALQEAAAVFEEIGAAWRRDRVLTELKSFGRAGRRAADAALGVTSLTARELEVARLAAQRLTSAEIATRLFISYRTVEGHLANVYVKLGVNSRPDLARKLAELAL
jgi:DNA-binding CsgD family transcriptional regulator